MKQQVFGEHRMRHFLRRYGVYLMLAVSLMAIAAVLVTEIGFGAVGSEPLDEPVEQIVTDQPDDRITTTTAAPTTTVTTTTTTHKEPELYVLPLTNTVQKPFSADAPLYSETMHDWRIHIGCDFAGEENQTVKATARGTVSEILEDPMWGSVIIIDHGIGVMSRYCGVKPSVSVGDKVEASTPIGTLETIPCESAQTLHLHFEMTLDGVPVDPVEAIALEVRYADSIHE